MKTVTTKKTPEFFANSFYTVNSEEYINYRDKLGKHQEDKIVPIIENALQAYTKPPLNILDIGCGFRNYINKKYINSYIGIDLSKSLLEHHPLRHNKKAKLIHSNFKSYNFNSLKYDTILAILSFNYIQYPKRYLNKIKRKNTFFFFVLPNPEYDKYFGAISKNGIVSLITGEIELIYYHHSTKSFIAAIGDVKQLAIEYTEPENNMKPPTYICFYGTW